MMTDTVADMLTRVRNAVRIEKPYVEMPTSKLKARIADVLKREGYIWDWRVEKGEPRDRLIVELKYGKNGERVIQAIDRVSKPGCRVYVGAADLKPVLGGLGISVVSTSQGVLSDREAKEKRVGGEVLCRVY